MIAMLTAVALGAQAAAPAEPDPEAWYAQATQCLGSLLAATGPQAPDAFDGERAEAALTWGLTIDHLGRRLGRSPEQQQTDIDRAEAFFTQVKTERAEALAAHRTWCQAIRP